MGNTPENVNGQTASLILLDFLHSLIIVLKTIPVISLKAAYSVKYKAKHKETCLYFPQWINQQKPQTGYPPVKYMLGMTPDGFLFYSHDGDFYPSGNTFLERKDWAIEIAIHKENDKWVYVTV